MTKLKSCMLILLISVLCGLLLVGCAEVCAPTLAEGESAAAPLRQTDVAALSYNATEPTVTTAGEVTLNLSNYSVVYSSGLRVDKAIGQQIADRLSVISGTSVPVKTASDSHKLVLVGAINSSDSLVKRAATLCDVSATGNEFGIAVIGNHIVIAGSSYANATLGAQYFLNTYLGDGADVNITLPRTVKANIASAQSIMQRVTKTDVATTTKVDGVSETTTETTYGTGGSILFSHVVYSDSLDHDNTYNSDSVYPPDGYGSASATFTGNDYLVDQAHKLRDWVNERLGGVTIDAYSDATGAQSGEILLGKTNRPETATALAMIDKTECIVAIIDGKLVATGHSTEAQLCAAEMVYMIFANGYSSSANTTYNNDKTVATTVTTYSAVMLPSDFCVIVKVNDEWVDESEILLPNLTEERVMDIYNGDYLYLYTNGVSKTVYDNYCAELEANGYVLVVENTLSGSYFKTYVHHGNAKMLQVDYNAFAKTSEALGSSADPTNVSTSSPKFSEQLFAYATPTIRIVASDWLSHDLPDDELLNPNQSYEKLTDSTITAIDLGEAGYGTGYIMMLEDGRFIVSDGGPAATDLDNVWSIFVDLYKRAHGGAEPTKENPVQIAAWIITHSHGDHVGMMDQFSHRFSGTYQCNTKTCPYCFADGERIEGDHGLVTLQYFMVNYPSRTELDGVAEAGEGGPSSYFYESKLIKPVTGQTMYLANARIETLFTHKDIYPQRTVAANDASTISRLNFVSTSGTGAKELDHNNIGSLKSTSFIATGDLYIQGSRWLCAMYGTDLKADMVAVAHHGGPGAESAFYDNVAPKVVWWPQSKSSAYERLQSNAWNNLIDYYVFYDLDSVNYIIISDDYNLTVTLTTSTDLDNLDLPEKIGNINSTSNSADKWYAYNKASSATTVKKEWSLLG